MDAGAHNLHDSGEVLGGVDQRTSEKPRNSVVWSVVETVIVIESEEAACVIGKNEGLKALGSELGSDKAGVVGFESLNDKEECDQCGSGEVAEVPSPVEQGTSKNSNNLVDGNVSETVVVTNSDEAVRVIGDNGKLVAKVDELGSSKALAEKSKMKVPKTEEDSYVIDVKCGSGKGFGDKREGETVCRICHLSSDQSPDRKMGTTTCSTTSDLIHLGCACKDELGVGHVHCAEAWFKLRGNRICEICGETAKNITGHGDSRFMEEWNESRFSRIGSNSSERNGGCWRGQPFCNFLMACLVIAFVLPWFFRVNMF